MQKTEKGSGKYDQKNNNPKRRVMTPEHSKENQKNCITVGFLFEVNKKRLKLETANGGIGFDREIRDKNIHRPGLAPVSYTHLTLPTNREV